MENTFKVFSKDGKFGIHIYESGELVDSIHGYATQEMAEDSGKDVVRCLNRPLRYFEELEV